MTRKDFQLVADVMAASTVTANLTQTQLEDLAYEFARKLRPTNARFDATRFFRACAIDTDTADRMADALDAGHTMFA